MMEATMRRNGVEGRGAWGCLMAVLVLVLVVTSARMHGQAPPAPDVMPHQGTLVNGDGVPLGTPSPKNYDVIFRIFDASSSGTLLWAEQQTVTVDAGRFSVQLGLGGAVGTEPRPSIPSLFRSPTASDRFLETTIKGVGPGRVDSTMMPRVRLLPVAYAMVSQYARTAERVLNSGGSGSISIVGARVGVNTMNPSVALDVAGDVRVGSMRVNGNIRTAGAATAVSWTGAGAVPVGTVILWSGDPSERPSGWALCDGTRVGGFQTPDLRGRFVLGAGAGAGLAQRSVGETGGAETHQLTASELPSHTHFMDIPPASLSFGGGHSHELSSEAHTANTPNRFASTDRLFGNGFTFNLGPERVSRARLSLETSQSSGHTHGIDLPGTESVAMPQARPHPNMPPYYVLAYIVRVQ